MGNPESVIYCHDQEFGTWHAQSRIQDQSQWQGQDMQLHSFTFPIAPSEMPACFPKADIGEARQPRDAHPSSSSPTRHRGRVLWLLSGRILPGRYPVCNRPLAASFSAATSAARRTRNTQIPYHSPVCPAVRVSSRLIDPLPHGVSLGINGSQQWKMEGRATARACEAVPTPHAKGRVTSHRARSACSARSERESQRENR